MNELQNRKHTVLGNKKSLWILGELALDIKFLTIFSILLILQLESLDYKKEWNHILFWAM